MVLSVEEHNVEKLNEAADEYADVMPTISRHFINEANTIKENCLIQKTPLHLNCQYCCTIFRPGNRSIKIIPRMKLNRKLKKLLQRSNTKTLGAFQRKMVQMYLNSQNRLKITCKICGKTTVIFCQSRKDRLTQKTVARETEPKKLSKSAKKRQKKKKKLSEDKDSGLDLSCTSIRSVFETKSKKAEKTLSCFSIKPMSTSTPKNNPSHSSAENTLSFLSINSMSQQNNSSFKNSSKSNSKKHRHKDKHGLLHKMLAQEKDKGKQNNSGSLKDFLSSL